LSRADGPPALCQFLASTWPAVHHDVKQQSYPPSLTAQPQDSILRT
jgi:hypothetical protein